MKNILNTCFLFLSIFFITTEINAVDKISAEEIVNNHLESIATKENRSQIANQMILGNVKISIKGLPVILAGKGLFLSSGEKNLFGINLASNDYPQDRFAYDGNKVQIGMVRPGTYSDIGTFLFSYKDILKDGLLGGTLSNSWALQNIDLKKTKLSYDGTKKIEGKETYVINYMPKGGSDLNIKMYFDKDTYHHLRTEYNLFIGARMGATVDSSAGQGETRQQLVESFSDYRKTGSLMLPNKYKINYSYYSSAVIQSAQRKNREVELVFDVANFSYNQELTPDSFNISAN